MAVGSSRICVALPVRNAAPFLVESIESVLAQQGVDLELRVYDNGSTDGTQDIVRRYLGDPRVSLTQNERDLNFYGSLDRALAETTATWYVPWGGDDVMLPGNLAAKLEAVSAAEVPFLFAPVTRIDETGRELGPGCAHPWTSATILAAPALFPRITPVNCIAIPAVLLDCAMLRRHGGWDTRLPLCADWHLWMRLSLSEPSVYFPRTLVAYREHGANGSAAAFRTGAFASELTFALADVFARDDFPRDWAWRERDQLVSVLGRLAQQHAAERLVRVADCPFPPYLLLLQALLVDPESTAVRESLEHAVRLAGLTVPSFPIDVVVAPELSADHIGAALAALRRLVMVGGLVARGAVVVPPGSEDKAVALIEAALARDGDLDLELVPASGPMDVLAPGHLYLAPFGDPTAALVERTTGALVSWQSLPDPLAA